MARTRARVALLLLVAAPSDAQLQCIYSIAGNSSTAGSYAGDRGPAYNASLNYPYTLTLDGAGGYFVADWQNNAIRQVSQAGIITTIAGNGTAFYSGDNGPASSALLRGPIGMDFNAISKVLLIADFGNSVIRNVTGGVITTVAGNGTAQFSGDGGPATRAALNKPYDATSDGAGGFYVADSYNNRVRRVDAFGIITTVAGTGQPAYSGDGGLAIRAALQRPTCVVLDGAGGFFIVDSGNNVVRLVNASGNITTVAGNGAYASMGSGIAAVSANFSSPTFIALDGAGGYYIADQLGNAIRRVTASGIVTTVAGRMGQAPAYSGDTGVAFSASFRFPSAAVPDGAGGVLVADSLNHRIRYISPPGMCITAITVATCASSTASTVVCVLSNVAPYLPLNMSLAGQPCVNITASSSPATLRGGACPQPGTGSATLTWQVLTYYTQSSTVSIAALPSPSATASAMSTTTATASSTPTPSPSRAAASGPQCMCTIAGTGGVANYTGDGGPAGTATLYQPTGPVGLDVGGTGGFTFCDHSNHAVRYVSGRGVISTVAGGNGAGYSGDAGPATSAQMYWPIGLAMNASGGFVVADTNNHVIRSVNSLGIVAVLAGTPQTPAYKGDGGPASSANLNSPTSVAFDSNSMLVIADTFNHVIRRVDLRTMIITTIAGTGNAGNNGDGMAATSTNLYTPWGVCTDGAGGYLIADTTNNAVRRLSTSTGNLNIVAGGAAGVFTGGILTAVGAALYYPTGVTLDGDGVVFTDSAFGAIRRVNGSGFLSTLAGNGTLGFRGDLGVAALALLDRPNGASLDGAGGYIVTDRYNHAIRYITPPGMCAAAVASCLAMAGGNATCTLTNVAPYLQLNASLAGVACTAATSAPATVRSVSCTMPSNTTALLQWKTQAAVGNSTIVIQVIAASPVPSASATATATVSASSTSTSSATLPSTATATGTASLSATATASATSSATQSGTATCSSTVTSSVTSTVTATGSASSTATATATASASASATASAPGGISSSPVLNASTANASATASVTTTASPSASTPLNASAAASTVNPSSSALAANTTAAATPSISAGNASASGNSLSTAPSVAAVTSNATTSPLALPSASATGSSTGTATPSSSSSASASLSPSSVAPSGVTITLQLPSGRVFSSASSQVLPLVVRDVDPPLTMRLIVTGCASACSITCSTSSGPLHVYPSSLQVSDGVDASLSVWASYRAATVATVTSFTCSTRAGTASVSVYTMVTPVALPRITDVLLHSSADATVVRSVWSSTQCNASAGLSVSSASGSSVLFLPSTAADLYDAAISSTCARVNAAAPATAFSLTCNGGSNITLVARAGFTATTRVRVGGVPVASWRASADGSLMHIQLPSAAALCGTYECGYVTLMVGTGPDSLVCPGSACTDVDGVVPLCNGTCIAAALATDGSTMPVPIVSGLGSRGGSGLYITSTCDTSVYADPATGACSNSSDPRYRQCAFGAGDVCSSCPANALCPGGFRAWPLVGFYTPSETSGVITQCAPPMTRCAGWDASQAVVACSGGYRARSYMCSACATGFYAQPDGICTNCPSTPSPIASLLPFAIFLGYIAAALLAMYCLMLVIALLVKSRTSDIHSRMSALAAWSFVTTQLVAQAGRAAAPGLPPILIAMYAALAVSELTGAVLPSSCIMGYPYVTEVAAMSIGLTALATAGLLLLYLRHHACTCVLALVLRISVMVLTLTYPAVVNSALSLVVCSLQRMSALTYLTLDGDGSTLTRSVTGDISAKTMVNVLVQSSNPTNVCYESSHTAAAALAWVALLLIGVLYPALCMLVVWQRIAGHVAAALAKQPESLPPEADTSQTQSESSKRLPSIRKGSTHKLVLHELRSTDVGDTALTSHAPTPVGGGAAAGHVVMHNPVISAARMHAMAPRNARNSIMDADGAKAAAPPPSASVQVVAPTPPVVLDIAPVPQKPTTRCGGVMSLAVDEASAVLQDPLLTVFVHSDYRPSCFMFYAVDRYVLLSLSVVNSTLRSSDDVSIATIAARTALVLLILLINGALLLVLSPFRSREWWKSAVKRLAIGLTIMITALNGMTSAITQRASASGSSPSAGDAAGITAGSYIVFALCVCLLAALPLAFMLNAIHPPPRVLDAFDVVEGGVADAGVKPADAQPASTQTLNPAAGVRRPSTAQPRAARGSRTSMRASVTGNAMQNAAAPDSEAGDGASGHSSLPATLAFAVAKLSAARHMSRVSILAAQEEHTGRRSSDAPDKAVMSRELTRRASNERFRRMTTMKRA